jgi:hypothetical protein
MAQNEMGLVLSGQFFIQFQPEERNTLQIPEGIIDAEPVFFQLLSQTAGGSFLLGTGTNLVHRGRPVLSVPSSPR